MKRVTLFCGHYGSGKTNLAVNYAFLLKAEGKEVSIADLDVVNPYFRTKDSEGELTAAGIEVVALPFANSSVDLPALPSRAYGLVQRRDRYVVLDIGGDDRGAYALGRFVPYILEENDFDMIYVANFYRPLTPTAREAMEVLLEIQNACGIPFTGIVNNSNLGCETTAADVEKTLPLCRELSALSGLPILYTSVEARLADAVKGTEVFPMRLQEKLF